MARVVQDTSVSRLGELLLKRGFHLGLAESCTGGMLGERITASSGASGYFLGGVISYDDRVKELVLAVPPALIVENGAVSAECALAMAHGVRRLLSADVAVSITGVAGPSGGTDAKPVGLTYIAVVTPQSERVEQHIWDGSRQDNREKSVEAALVLVINSLVGEDKD
jgi:nicotinamide-nucleotide amidase